MGDKSVEAVPGIGKELSKHMKDRKVTMAKQLYGIFLWEGPDGLKDFVRSNGANNGQVKAATEAMKEWDRQHN